MSELRAIICDQIFDGEKLHRNSALLLSGDQVVSVVKEQELPEDCEAETVSGGLLAPGFVDLQVNGGGGILFNEQPDCDAIRTMCQAHAQFGTTALMPTLITDSREVTLKAIDAAIEANRKDIPGFLGLHLEGPHLSLARKGAHDPAFIRPMEEEDVGLLCDAADQLPYLMVTLAPESVSIEQVRLLAASGIIVSLGHSDSSARQITEYIDAGARCITHLFNAMSQLGNREPGVVGAALASNSAYAGLIADGHHVHPITMELALRAKRGPGRIFLVTDAMSTIGTDIKSFHLNGRVIHREDGCLRLADGTLAGADLDMANAVWNIQKLGNIDQYEAIRMASTYPAEVLDAADIVGTLRPGTRADMILLDSDNRVSRTWWKGVPSEVKADHAETEDN